MRLRRRQRRPLPEATVPLINIVFLLLIFFMLAGELAETPPFRVTPPEGAASDLAEGRGNVVYMAADGRLAVGARTGLDLDGVAEAVAGRETVLVAADAQAPGSRLVALMTRLRQADVATLRLRTRGEG